MTAYAVSYLERAKDNDSALKHSGRSLRPTIDASLRHNGGDGHCSSYTAVAAYPALSLRTGLHSEG